MNKNKIISLVLIIIALGFLMYLLYSNNLNTQLTNEDEQNPTASTSVLYSNANFGFIFALPNTWKGYSVVNTVWEGNPLTTTSTKETGIKLLIRNPKWTEALHYEDIPVMIFTIKQWNSYVAENFSVSAAPIMATELGRNNLYVLALPPRWNFDYSKGYEEAENILKSNPIKTYTVGNTVSGKLNINVICEGALTYMTFPNGKSADTFVSECKEGKHPEVIEKYKAQMNIGDGANI